MMYDGTCSDDVAMRISSLWRIGLLLRLDRRPQTHLLPTSSAAAYSTSVRPSVAPGVPSAMQRTPATRTRSGGSRAKAALG